MEALEEVLPQDPALRPTYERYAHLSGIREQPANGSEAAWAFADHDHPDLRRCHAAGHAGEHDGDGTAHPLDTETGFEGITAVHFECENSVKYPVKPARKCPISCESGPADCEYMPPETSFLASFPPETSRFASTFN